MTRGVDLLSRTEIFDHIAPTSIPKEELEYLGQESIKDVPQGFTFSPEALYKLMTSSLSPSFLSKVPYRKMSTYARFGDIT